MICGLTMPDRITKLLVELILPLASLMMLCFGAYATWRQHWFRARPLLSVYVWLQAIVGVALFLLYRLLQACSSISKYTLCQIYSVGCQAFAILTCFLTLAVIYEFLFCADGADKPIRQKATKGFGTAASSVIAGAGILGCAAPDVRTLPGATNVLDALTALALVFSSIYILNIKKSRSLFANSRMAMVFWLLAFQGFTNFLVACLLRNSEQIRSIISAEIWMVFTIFLYLALKNGPQSRADQIRES